MTNAAKKLEPIAAKDLAELVVDAGLTQAINADDFWRGGYRGTDSRIAEMEAYAYEHDLEIVGLDDFDSDEFFYNDYKCDDDKGLS